MSALDDPNAPARACPGCNVTTDYRDLVRIDARTVRCAECVRESVAQDEDRDAQHELADRGALSEHDLDTFAELVVARYPALSAVGT